jgi:hypothetical protein
VLLIHEPAVLERLAAPIDAFDPDGVISAADPVPAARRLVEG